MDLRVNDSGRFRLRLGVFGEVAHFLDDAGLPVAFEPYVRELRVWADLFQEVHVYSPSGVGETRANVVRYDRANMQWHPVQYSLRPGRTGALCRLAQLPGLMAGIRRAFRGVDYVQLRSPSQMGFIGAALARVMRRPSITKWAGLNGQFPGQSFTARLDYRLQAVPNPRNPVLVYGPAKRPHQISFIPALMSEEELATAGRLAAGRSWCEPWEMLCVGRLSPEKNFPLVVQAVHLLKRQRPALQWRLTLVGDGPERGRIARCISDANLGEAATMTGALPFQAVQPHYARAHILILPNPNEGWPKVIAEAWAHGAIPVAARGGIVPHIMQDENSGVIFEPTPEALATALAALLGNPGRMQTMAQGIHRFAADLSLEQFKHRLERVLVERCGLKTNP